IDCGCIFRAGVITVHLRVQSEELRHPGINRTANGTDIDPSIPTFECVVWLESRRPITGVPVHRTLTGEEWHAVPLSLGYCLELSQVNNLPSACLFDFPQRHHCGGPPSESGQIIAGECLCPLGWATRVARYVHHTAESLGQRVITGTPQVFLLPELTVCTDTHDDEAGIDCQCEFVANSCPLNSSWRRGFHPHV